MENYYLFGVDGSMNKLVKTPEEMLEFFSINNIPKIYKHQYFQLVLTDQLNNLMDLGLLGGDRVPDEKIIGAENLKNIIEEHLDYTLGEDVVDGLKAELEVKWQVTFNDEDIPQEILDKTNEMFDDLNIETEEEIVPPKMFP